MWTMQWIILGWVAFVLAAWGVSRLIGWLWNKANAELLNEDDNVMGQFERSNRER